MKISTKPRQNCSITQLQNEKQRNLLYILCKTVICLNSFVWIDEFHITSCEILQYFLCSNRQVFPTFGFHLRVSSQSSPSSFLAFWSAVCLWVRTHTRSPFQGPREMELLITVQLSEDRWLHRSHCQLTPAQVELPRVVLQPWAQRVWVLLVWFLRSASMDRLERFWRDCIWCRCHAVYLCRWGQKGF